jgi:uncharacterized protein with HEPN domain
MPRDFRLYLDDILEAVTWIREYTAGLDQHGLAEDRKTLDAVVRNLEIIGEAARNLPDEWKVGASGIEWRKIVALRNLLAHEYFGISIPIVWDIVQNKLGPLEKACKKILNSLEGRNSD